MREFRACRRGDPEAWKPPSQFKMRLGKAKRLVRRIPPLFVPQLGKARALQSHLQRPKVAGYAALQTLRDVRVGSAPKLGCASVARDFDLAQTIF